MILSLVNGIQSELLALNDRGLAFGDGVFTTGLLKSGQLIFRAQHLARLVSGCKRLAIANLDLAQLEQDIDAACKLASNGEFVLKIIITAGKSERGYARNIESPANRYLQIASFPQHYKQWQNNGINVGISSFKLGINPAFAGLKHLNRLEQVMVKQLVQQSGFDDLLVFDLNNHLIESSLANVFWSDGKNWFTPELNTAGVDGIIRQQILAQFPLVKESHLHRTKTEQIKSLFLTNCLMGVVPVKTLCERSLALNMVKPFQDVINHD